MDLSIGSDRVPAGAETGTQGSESVRVVNLMIKPSREVASEALVKLVLMWTSFFEVINYVIPTIL